MPDASTVPHAKSSNAYNNQLLFTEHYLEHRITEQAVWTDLDVYNLAKAKLAQLQAKRQEVQPQNLKEAQLEKQYIHWILSEILGHHFAVQVTLDYGDKKHGVPDMVFTATSEEAAAIGNDRHNAETLNKCIAIGDAKAWGIAFDKASKGSQSPAKQIDTYLRYSELPWGILSDGRYWRLYERNSSKFNKYYEVDLESILESDDASQFLYFFLFFRQEAYTSGWLDNVLKGSQDYAESLRDSLEEEVFAALEHIAQGFLTYRRNRFEKNPNAEQLQEIYEYSLILLYRLLFVFYAESRDVLPMDNETYKKRSLQNLTRQAKFIVDEGKKRNADDSTLYAPLRDLFFNIDMGNPDYDITPYNGKLFSGSQHPFLENNWVGDYHLAPAIHRLATIKVKRNKKKVSVSVDYKDLDVSHLGTIYEKLLEYRLDIAKEDLITSGKNQTYKAAKANQTPTKKKGEVYLRTGNNERKVTGSYYTPEYIVRFIVEKTLEPLLREISEAYASLDEEGNWQVSGDPETLRDAILALNVLDPATGSGHFAVDVVVYIAEWLHSLALDLPELENEADHLSYWMRQVASSCIYAVDINPLAVELAKLSIWLKTLARDKPLSFLDHHIRVGNSLVGTSLAEIQSLAPNQPKKRVRSKKISEKQAALFGEEHFTLNVETAVSTMAQIERTQAHDVNDVKEQEKLYEDLRERLQPFEDLATVWTARHFGLHMYEGEWEELYRQTMLGERNYRLGVVVQEAEAISAQADMRFFHWDVAFPEVFFDANGKRLDNAGFDAVVGNPPYVRWQSFSKPLKDYLNTRYEIYNSSADLYLYFYELGLVYLKENKRLGFITSGTYMNSGSAKEFRKFIHENVAFEWMINFGENQPFKDAEMVYPTIAIIKSEQPKPTFKHHFMDGTVRYDKMGETFDNANWVNSLSSVTSMNEWRFQSIELTKLFEKISEAKSSLEDYTNGNIYYGVLTGLNDAFVISKEKRDKLILSHASSKEIIHPMLRGQDLRPWYQTNNDLYLIAARQGINIDNYPAIKQHLEFYYDRLKVKPANWNNKENGKWSGRTTGNYEWYEWHDTVAYYEFFEKPIICWADISKLPRFSWNYGSYVANTGFIIGQPTWHLLAMLQSRVLWFALSQYATPLRLRAGLWQYRLIQQFVKRLPIPDLSSAQESELATIAETITSYAQERYEGHADFRASLSNSFGDGQDISNRIDLYTWWDFENEADLSADMSKRKGWSGIPANKLTEWRKYLAAEKAKHADKTNLIIAEETRMNAIVYDAFKLDEAERRLIETATKYPYGAV